jgi:hypothetical protein
MTRSSFFTRKSWASRKTSVLVNNNSNLDRHKLVLAGKKEKKNFYGFINDIFSFAGCFGCLMRLLWTIFCIACFECNCVYSERYCTLSKADLITRGRLQKLRGRRMILGSKYTWKLIENELQHWNIYQWLRNRPGKSWGGISRALCRI